MFKSNPKKKLKAIGINIYGGGFTIGALNHFDVVAQLEEINLGCRTFDMNFEGIFRPIVNHTQWPLKDYIKKVDFVYANPPCVPWSSASSFSARTGQRGTRKGKTIEDRFNDPLLDLTESTMGAAIKIRPNIFISESVENAYNIGVRHYDQYVEAWLKAGYAVTFFLTDALLHGAACRRRRFHFIAHNVALKLPNAPIVNKPVTFYDVVKDLKKRKLDPSRNNELQHYLLPMGKFHKLEYKPILKNLPEWARLRHKDWDPKASIHMRKLAWNMPTPTVLRFHHFIHPDGERFISFREGLRACSYPDDYRAASEIDAADAVLPIVAEFLSGVAKESIKAAGNQKPTHQVVDWRPIGKPLFIRPK
jgi:site-specific DNA-cytosine methylase